MNHIMVDLETLSTRPTAAILSIGAVKFDLEKEEIGSEFYRAVKLQSCIDFGLSIDGSTLSFWAQQPELARQVFWEPNSGDLGPVLLSFREWVLDYPIVEVDKPPKPNLWGNGAAFDNVILRNAFRVCQLDYPFSHKEDLCYRTVKHLYRMKFPEDRSTAEKPHQALEDARLQAVRLIMMWKRMKI